MLLEILIHLLLYINWTCHFFSQLKAIGDMNNAAERIEDLERERSILANKADNKSLADQGQKLNVQKAAQEIQSVTDIQLSQMEKSIDNYKRENESMWN